MASRTPEESVKNIMGFGKPPEGAICYRRNLDNCQRPPTRLLVFADDTGCTVCDYHYALGVVEGTKLFVTDRPEDRVVMGMAGSVVMYRVRCPACNGLIEYDNQILFTPDEYAQMPDVLECDTPDCGAQVEKPRPEA